MYLLVGQFFSISISGDNLNNAIDVGGTGMELGRFFSFLNVYIYIYIVLN